MLKFLIFTSGFIALTQASSLPLDDELERIAGGFNAGKFAPKCYTTLRVTFMNSDVYRVCGGCLIAANKVLTSGNCVTTPEDGTASMIKFTFGKANNKNGQRGYGVSKVALAPGYNYLIRNSTNDLAVVTLNNTVKLNNNLQACHPYVNSTQDAFVGQQLLVCGYGYTDNNNKRPNSLRCANLTIVAATNCNPAFTTTIPATTTTMTTTTPTTTTTTTTTATTTPTTTTTTISGATTTSATTTTTAATTTTSASTTTGPTTTVAAGVGALICTKSMNGATACHGDEGAPVFLYINGMPQLIGVVSNFPNSRASASCLDGHSVAITQLGSFTSFLSTA